MNKREIVGSGLYRGYSIGNNIDVIDIGDYVDGRFADESKNVKVTTDNWHDVHENIAYECESNDRSFSPFEHTAHDINQYEDKFDRDAWGEFDEAITRGIRKALKKRWLSVTFSKDDYWKSFEGSRELFNSCWCKLRKYAKSSIDLDFNENQEVERWLEQLSSELVNDSTSRFYIHG